jgi:hypothetical protein
MTDSLWRLAWALPLVLTLGVVAMLVLKRVLSAGGPLEVAAEDLVLQRSLKLSETATAHVIAVEGKKLMIVESTAGVTAIELDTKAAPRPHWGRLLLRQERAQ